MRTTDWKTRRVGKSEPLFRRLVAAAQSTITTPMGNAINEIRGHVTAPLIREWALQNAEHPGADRVVLVRAPQERMLCAFMIDEKDEAVYDKNGKRVALSVPMNSMSDEIAILFGSEVIVVLELGDK